MSKRLEKRHKRQVSRARERVKVSEPDVRTPEEIKAAREVSRAIVQSRNDPRAQRGGPQVRGADGSAANVEGENDL
jgi:hypothetical protein